MPIKVKSEDDGFTISVKIVANIIIWLGGVTIEVWAGFHILALLSKLFGKG